MGLSNRLKEARKAKGYSRVQLAEKVGVTPSAISNYENGISHPRDTVLCILMNTLECDANYLFQDEINITPKKGIRIPVLGRIPAGIPIEAIEEIENYEEIPDDWLRGGAEYFALKVTGNSMFPKYLDNDVVIFKKTQSCDSGAECAVIVNNNDATFKRIIRQENGIILQPLNTSDFNPEFYNNASVENLPINIIGVAVEIRRRA